MTAALTSIPAAFATGLVLFYGAQKFFKSIEDVLSEEMRDRLGKEILGVEVAIRTTQYATMLENVIERVFGKDHWTFCCFWRSIVASALVFLLTYSILAVITWQTSSDHALSQISTHYLGSALLLAAVNILPNYLALAKSRAILAWVRLTDAPRRVLYAGLIDLCLSALIAYLPALFVVSFIVWVVGALFGHWAPTLSSIPQAFAKTLKEFAGEALLANAPGAVLSAIWTMLFAIGRMSLTISRKLDIGFKWISGTLDVAHKPLQCVGLATGIVLATGYWMLLVCLRILND